MQDSITVTLPARREFVHVLRSVVASIAARLNFSIDALEDLRLVVDEACGQLLAMPGAEVLVLKISPTAESLEFTVSTDGHYSWPPQGHNALAWEILAALSDSIDFQQLDGPTIRLGKRIQTASP